MNQQKFIDRKKELKFLEDLYKSKRAEMVIIYGRRRIGKTELIKQFSKNKKHVYYLCERTTENKNIEGFKERVSLSLNLPHLHRITINDWKTIFEIIKDKLKERIVIILDEFQFLIEINRGVVSVFQKIWDEILKDTKVFLILCGSSVGMMETEILGYKSPLYGRRTAQWKLGEMEIKYFQNFLPDYSFQDILYVYGIVGGVPHYLSKLENKIGIYSNIKKHFLKKGGFFYEEAENLLRQEFREPRNYSLILRAISEGKTSFGKIVNSTGMDKAAVSRYLEILHNLNMIGYKLPMFSSKKSKKRNYYIKDNYLNFWFRFIYPNKSCIEECMDEMVFQEVKKFLPAYFSPIFERICLKFLFKIFSNSFPYLGKWWWKDREIDILGLNEKTKQILFCECKWQDRVNPEKILKELEEKTQWIDWEKEKRKESFGIFAKSFRKKISEWNGKRVYCWDLRDLERELRKGKIFKF